MFTVGITESCEVLGVFRTHDLAAEFISQLPNHEDGIYYIDGPCDKWITPKGILMVGHGWYRDNYSYEH